MKYLVIPAAWIALAIVAGFLWWLGRRIGK